MEEAYAATEYFWFAIEFHETNHKVINYTLRFSNIPRLKSVGTFRVTWKTVEIMPQISVPGPRSFGSLMGGTPGYYEEGFVYVQHELAMAVAETRLNETSDSKAAQTEINLDAMRFPFPPYIEDVFIVSLGFLFPMVIVFSFVYPAVNLSKSLVVEKERRIKESMKMMGLKEFHHWISYFIKSIIFTLPSLTIVIVLLFVKFSQSTAMLNHSDFSLVFLFFFVYEITNILLCFMISSFFSKASCSCNYSKV